MKLPRAKLAEVKSVPQTMYKVQLLPSTTSLCTGSSPWRELQVPKRSERRSHDERYTQRGPKI